MAEAEFEPNAQEVQPVEDPSEVVQQQEVEEDTETWASLIRPFLAEFIGSAAFIFIACGSGMTTVGYNVKGAKTLGIALSFGLTIFCLCFAIGHISGAHLNFAVTFTLTVLKRISLKRCFVYFAAQWLGGLIGVGFLKLITPSSQWKSCFAANSLHYDAAEYVNGVMVTPAVSVSPGAAFVAEIILTFFLVFVVMAACDSNKSNQTFVPLAIGLTVFCAHMIGLQIDGCSINPTRSFASAAAASGVSGCERVWDNHWVYWFGPLVGGLLAGFLYEYCFHEGGGKVDRLLDQYVLKKSN